MDNMQQIIQALKEPPVAKLVECSIEELSMMDIPLLLSDYKRLAALVSFLASSAGAVLSSNCCPVT